MSSDYAALVMSQSLERLRAKYNSNLPRIDPVTWIERNFYIPELRAPMKVAPYQARALREALSIGRDGLFKYSTIIWGEIKKSAKTSIQAGVMDWLSSNMAYSSGKFVANTLDQADSRASKMLRTNFTLHPRPGVEVIPSRNLIRYPNQSEVKSIPINPSAEAGGNDSIVAFDELWGAHEEAKETMWCYDQETEILTLDGWKGHATFQEDDIVACYNPDTDGLEWHQAQGLYRERYVGKMHFYGGKKFSHCVTPNHRLYGLFSSKGKGDPNIKSGIMRSDELRDSVFGVFHPKTSLTSYESFETEVYKEFPATTHKEKFRVEWGDWCEYAGWFVSEGYVRHQKRDGGLYPTQVSICQERKVNTDEWDKIKELHDRVFADTVGYAIRESETLFSIHSVVFARECLKMGNTSYEKRVPSEIKNSKPEHLKRFLEAYLLGDGTVNDAGSPVASTHSRQLTDDLMEIGIRLGYRVSIRQNGSNGGYRVTFAKDDGYGHYVERRYDKWKEIDYDGIVWCPSVPTGIVVTRRNGTVCISGNTEMTLSPTRMGKSFRWVSSYAGYLGESNLLWSLYNLGVDEYAQFPGQGKRFDWCDDFDPPLECYHNDAARLFCLWNTVPRLSWQTPEYYAQEASILVPSEFNRVHRNQWSAAVEAFVPIEWWDACKVDQLPPLDESDFIIVGIDGAVSFDCFGIVAVSRHQDKIAVRYIGEWKPPQGGKIRFVNETDPDDIKYPEGVCRHLFRNYNVLEFAYDQTHLAEMTGRLQRSGFGFYKVFSQGRDRLVSDKMLYDMIARKGIMHDGDPRLRSHIQNANAEFKGDKTVRIVKRAPSLHIDLAVSLSMAVQRAMIYRIG